MVGHEMAGVLERVRRVSGAKVGLAPDVLPADGIVEVALLSAGAGELSELVRQTNLDLGHYRRLPWRLGARSSRSPATWPIRPGSELSARPASWGPWPRPWANPWRRWPGWVPSTDHAGGLRPSRAALPGQSAPVGGRRTEVGLAVRDSVSVSQRSARVAELLAGAGLIIESAVAMAQELHDGPFELFTGHGLWAWHEGLPTFSLLDKAIVRIDLDPQIAAVWQHERQDREVSRLIAEGKPKAIGLGCPGAWR